MKSLTLILILFCLTPVFGQTNIDFKNELSEHKFTSVKKRNIPIDIFKIFGCDSYKKVGTRRTQTGCTSGKRIVVNWAVTDKNGLYIMSVATCGRASNTSYYIISKGEKYNTNISQDLDTFDDFKRVYLR